MKTFQLITSLFLLALLGVSIYALVSSRNLSLPIPLRAQILALLLIALAFINIDIITPWLLENIARRGHNRDPEAESSKPPPSIHHWVLYAIHTLQGALTTVIATVFFSGGLLPGGIATCGLQEGWVKLWRDRDGLAIEKIQDALGCCGFKTVRDMAWPPSEGRVSLCAEMYHRSSSCVEPWAGAMRRSLGLEFGVAIALGLLQ
ncbi:hypothetical protein BX600DRAFT_545616, partial [Xylariales sp. PMI_506]